MEDIDIFVSLRVPKHPRCLSDENRLLEGLNGVIAIHDDITMCGKDDDVHDQNLIALMERAQQVGLTFNSKKCTIRQPKISFFSSLW